MLEVNGYMNSLYSLISIFVRLQVKKAGVFKNDLHTGESV